jgi:predicted protein tyrosine phosphatase
MIHVCSLSRLAETVERTGARHVVTLINEGTPVERPAVVTLDNHLRIGINDIVAAADGMVLAGAPHVETLLGFVRARWDRRAPLVIHCYAGISRSTAAAFVTACALAPERDEEAVARALRRASPTATPNAHLVALADAHLGREGRMVRAIDGIGRGTFAAEGKPFMLALE